MSTQVLFLKVVYYIAGKQSRVIGCSEREFFLDPRLTVDRPTSLFRLPCFPTDLCLFVSPVIPELTCVSELRARDVSVYHTYGWICVCALTQRGGTPAANYTFNWSICVGGGWARSDYSFSWTHSAYMLVHVSRPTRRICPVKLGGLVFP